MDVATDDQQVRGRGLATADQPLQTRARLSEGGQPAMVWLAVGCPGSYWEYLGVTGSYDQMAKVPGEVLEFAMLPMSIMEEFL